MSQPNPDELARYWDAYATGSNPDSEALDPSLADVIQRLHTAKDVDGADPIFLNRLMEDLMSPMTSLPLPRLGSVNPVMSPNGYVRGTSWGSVSIARPATKKHGPRGSVLFAVALIGLLALGIGYAVLGPQLPWTEHRKTIPAAVVSETPSPTVPEHRPFEITIPADAAPHGAGVVHSVVHYTMLPGKRSTWTPTCCVGPVVEYVLEGSYSVRAEAPIEVVRADGSVETVPSGVEVVLTAGDGLLTRIETSFEGANPGEVPLELLTWVAVEANNEFGGRALNGWSEGRFDYQGWPAPVSGPIVFRIEPTMLTGGDVLTKAPDALELVVTISETVFLPKMITGTETERTVVGPDNEPAPAYIITVNPVNQPSASPSAGTPVPIPVAASPIA